MLHRAFPFFCSESHGLRATRSTMAREQKTQQQMRRAAPASWRAWALALALLLVAVARTDGCGHHGDVAQRAEAAIQRHHRHKALLASDARQRHLQQQDGQEQPSDPLLSQLARIRDAILHQDRMTAAPEAAGNTPPSAAAGEAAAEPVRLHVQYQDGELDQASHATLAAVTSAVVRALQGYLAVRWPVRPTLLVSPLCTAMSPDRSTCTQWFPAFPSASTSNSPSAPVNSSSSSSTSSSSSSNTAAAVHQNPDTETPAQCGHATIDPAHILDPSTCTLPNASSNDSSSTTSTCRSFAGTPGLPADTYLYVTSVQDEQCNRGAAAWALPCMFDAATNRPLLTSANICPFSLSGAISPDLLVAIVLHEVLHALGFTSALFSSFIDPSTRLELPLSSVQRQVTVSGRQVTRIITPTVAREARRQFGCEALDGAQLEDEGGSGSANSHWEYTHYQGELMLASTLFSVAGEAPRLSRLTLALLEDSGWYVGNWTAAGGSLAWAQGTGCTLPQRGCQQYARSAQGKGLAAQQQQQQPPPQQLFCDAAASVALGSSLRYSPTASFRSVGQCGTPSFASNCSMVMARGGAPTCTLVNYQYNDADVYGWYHGTSSRAYAVTYKMSVSLNDGSGSFMYFPAAGGQGDEDAVCFPSSCQGGLLHLHVRDKLVRCPSGSYVDLSQQLPGVFREGVVGPCPDEAQVCRTLSCAPTSCHPLGGWCQDGACICKIGWTGAHCAFSLLTNTTVPFAANSTEGVTPPAPAPSAAASGDASVQVQNVTGWYQQVTVSLELSGLSTLAAVSARAALLQAVVALWADVPLAQVQVLGAVMVGSSGDAGDTPAAASSSGNQSWVAASGDTVDMSTVAHGSSSEQPAAATEGDLEAGQHSEAALATTSSGRKLTSHSSRTDTAARHLYVGLVPRVRRALWDVLGAGLGASSTAPSPPPGDVLGAGLGASSTAPSPPPGATSTAAGAAATPVGGSTPPARVSAGLEEVVKVTLGVRPSSTLSTILVMNRLADTSQQQVLQSQLRAAGLALVPGSLDFTLTILRQTITISTNLPPVQSLDPAQGTSPTSATSSSRQLSWRVVAIAVGAGVGALLVSVTVLAVACLSHTAAARRRALEEQQHEGQGQGGKGSLGAVVAATELRCGQPTSRGMAVHDVTFVAEAGGGACGALGVLVGGPACGSHAGRSHAKGGGGIGRQGTRASATASGLAQCELQSAKHRSQAPPAHQASQRVYPPSGIGDNGDSSKQWRGPGALRHAGQGSTGGTAQPHPRRHSVPVLGTAPPDTAPTHVAAVVAGTPVYVLTPAAVVVRNCPAEARAGVPCGFSVETNPMFGSGGGDDDDELL